MCGGLGMCFNCRNKHIKNDKFRLDATTLDSQNEVLNYRQDSNSSTQEIDSKLLPKYTNRLKTGMKDFVDSKRNSNVLENYTINDRKINE